MVITKCGQCGEESLYKMDAVPARGVEGPDLLPGLGGFWMGAKFQVVVCSHCGLTQFYADEKARSRLATSGKWEKI